MYCSKCYCIIDLDRNLTTCFRCSETTPMALTSTSKSISSSLLLIRLMANNHQYKHYLYHHHHQYQNQPYINNHVNHEYHSKLNGCSNNHQNYHHHQRPPSNTNKLHWQPQRRCRMLNLMTIILFIITMTIITSCSCIEKFSTTTTTTTSSSSSSSTVPSILAINNRKQPITLLLKPIISRQSPKQGKQEIILGSIFD